MTVEATTPIELVNGVYATLDGSRVDTSEFADPEWAGAELEPDRPTRPGNGPPDPSLRDDAELAAELRDLLTGEPDLADASIAVSVEGGEVLLAGHVRDTRCKHLAEDLAYRVAGVLDVTNLLIVASIDGALERDLDAPAARAELARTRDQLVAKQALTRDVLDGEVARLVAMGIVLRCGEKVEDLSAAMAREGADAVFLAVGAHIAKRAFIPAGDSARVLDAVSVLRSMEGEERPLLGRRVVVYGGDRKSVV